jgi:hypothetical protein
MTERSAHAALQIGSVGQAADGARLPLGITGAQRSGERSVVLGAALLDPAAREIEVAAIVVNLGEAAVVAAGARGRLGFGKRRQRVVDAGD